LFVFAHGSPAQVEDHTGRSMWMGSSFKLDLTVLSEDLGFIPLQYPGAVRLAGWRAA
jgi:hypothetical protein